MAFGLRADPTGFSLAAESMAFGLRADPRVCFRAFVSGG
jgi:hypothetical protein